VCISEIELGINLILKISQIGGREMKDVKPFSKEEKEGWETIATMFIASIIVLVILKIIFHF
jgi:hypothetical protein